MPDYSAEIALRVSRPLAPHEMVDAIWSIMVDLGVTDPLVAVGTEIKIVGTMPEQVIHRLPIDQPDARIELLDIEAEPIGGPRH